MMLLNITDCSKSFMLSPEEAIDLEIKLNSSRYNVPWRDIGDVLYEFGLRSNKAVTNLAVSTEQFQFLELLRAQTDVAACRAL